MLEDRFGLALSTESAAAAAAYVSAVDLILSANAGAEKLLDDALRRDPEFALAHAARARALQLAGRVAEARAAAAAAEARSGSLSERERRHVRIVALAVAGRGSEAYAALGEHLETFPRDALPLSLALGVYGLLGFSGRIDHHEANRSLLEGLTGKWDDDWWFLTFLAWARIEAGAPGEGIPLVDRALELNPGNGHAAHARAHGYYELGDPDGGRAFVAGWLPGYGRTGQLHCHLSWHLALFMLQQGEADRALAVYRDDISLRSLPAPTLLSFVDCASFLWRRVLHGDPPGPAEAEEIAEYAGTHVPAPALAFFNLHIALALAAAGENAALDRHIDAVERLIADGKQAAGPVIGTLCRGIADYARGEYGAAAASLERALGESDRLGGSHAQRDVIIDSLIAAHLRAGEPGRAEQVMRQRADARAGHLDRAWLARIGAG